MIRPSPIALPTIVLLSVAACTGNVSSADDDGPSNGGKGGGSSARTGGSGGTTGPQAPTTPSSNASCKRPLLPTGLRRLSRPEYVNTLRDLFVGIDVGQPRVTPDQSTLGFENRADDLFATDANVSDFNTAAADVAAKAVKSLDKLLPGCAAQDHACAAKFVESFGKRAFRRPLTDEEKQRYTAFIDQQTTNLGSFAQAVQLAVEGMLQSSSFLYRPELGGTAKDGVVRVTGYEMASRLSYFLWGSMPDDKLFAAADKGLASDADVMAEATRMLSDDKARTQIVDFHRQWLEYDHVSDTFLKEGAKDKTLYPDYGAELVASMRAESDRFTGKVMFDGTHTLKELFTSSDTFVDGPLAKLYGVPAPATPWSPVKLPEAQRGGLFTRAAFLAGRAHKLAGSPPLRAVFLMGRVMCQAPSPPPPGANTSEPMNGGGSAPKTNRQLFEDRVKEQASCPACHNAIDGIGFTFEHYDAVGGYRDKDNGLAVDASGSITLDDAKSTVADAKELSAKLASSEQVLRCMTEQWFQFAIQRDVADSDACAVDGLTKAIADAGGDVRKLQLAILGSPDFLYRPAP